MFRFNIKFPITTLQILIIAVVILVLRLVLVSIYLDLEDSSAVFLYDAFHSIIQNKVLIIFIISVNILSAIFLNKFIQNIISPVIRLIVEIGQIFLLTVLATLIYYAKPILSGTTIIKDEIIITAFASLIVTGLIFCITYIVQYIISTNKKISSESSKRHKAQYQYIQLKQQLNPHFLFNSLNILDFLVINNQKERASSFINKLANIYRYLLSKEDDKLVPLKDEIKFVELYLDLLRERFMDGLNVKMNIEPICLNKQIIPCGLQILVENAIKHNIVHQKKPLLINIYTNGNSITVENNLQPRISSKESTQIGLNNIARQYKDIANKSIIIKKTETHFLVTQYLI